jgi:hypothetical protein
MARPFFETLRDLRSGHTLEDLGEQLSQIVAAVKATGKSGELTLKLKIKPPKSGGISYLMIEDSLSAKVPKLDHGDTVFFPTKDGGLSRMDQSQGELPLRGVTTVDNETGEIIELGGK